MTHSFDVEVASEVGLVEAIFLQHFEYWHIKNVANNKHFYDGRTWTYNSIRGYVDIFPYLTEKQIRGVLDKLEKAELIASGNYNKNTFDRTKWYALTDKAICLLGIMHLPSRANRYIPNGQMETPSKANGFVQKGEPIPVIKPIVKSIKDTITTEPENQKLAEARSDGESFNDLSRKDNQRKADVSDQSDDPQWLQDQKEKQKETMRPSSLLTWEEAEAAIRKNEQCKRIAESTKKANQAFNWTFDGLLTAFLTYNKGTYGEVSNWKSEAAARKNFIQWLPKFLVNNKAPLVEASQTSTRQSNLDLLNRLSQ